MQELVDKIQEVTRDGSPTVGQWIELGDLAKKYKVKKTEMEKMVEEALNQEPSESHQVNEEEAYQELANSSDTPIKEEKTSYSFEYKREDSFERPNFEFNRDQFEQEMMNRREQEGKMFEREDVSSPEIEQPEVVFPELNVSFDQPVEKVEFKTETIAPPKEGPIAPIQTNIEPPKQEEFVAPEIPAMDFSVEVENPSIEFEDVTTTDFDDNPDEFESATIEYDNIADFIAESNKRALREAQQREGKEQQRTQKTQKSTQTQKQKPKPKQKSTSQRARSNNSSMVTQQEAKKALTIGIVAGATGLLFGFIGIFVGLYGLNFSNKLKQEIDESSNLYGDQIKQNVSIGRGLSIVGVVIGSIRLFNSFSDLFF